MAFFKLALPSRFEVVRRIGEGGMGVVYEAVDLERDERVALKTILHHDADTIARVKHEFRALQDIHHPNLVTLRELVADADDVFFTMDLVDGVDLRVWVRGEARRGSPSGSPTAVDLRSGGDPDTLVDDAVGTPTPVSGVERRASRSVKGFDEARLRDAFRQVALGLSALHAAGKVHRDVKPSNVRVTPAGRVVLLDFGLVFEVDARQHTEGHVVGTPAYMAPEQASTAAVGPPADWYAVGVMLYECLAGRRPFEGAADVVLATKHYRAALAPSAFIDDVPRDLEELCMELLRVEPLVRPTGEDVLRRLDARTSDRPPTSSETPFVGRNDELRALERAFVDVGAGGTVTVALHGESGVGKSCLVRRFLQVALSGRDDVLVLSGRCYEREAVPYKALDEIIETLSRRLARLPRQEVVELLPVDSIALALVFPAMGRIAGLDARGSIPDRDPLERRRAAFRALKELLCALARKHRIVLTIDDLQWTDADSLHLLQELLRPPDAPNLLLVVTMRGTNDDGAAPALASQLSGDVRAVRVGRLARENAQRLAEVLLARVVGSARADAGAIAAEADGHPLFIDELVRHATIASDVRVGALRLDDALYRRVERLDPAARRVLDVACVLGAPVSQDVIAHAAGIDMGELARAVSLLRATNFVRTDGARVGDAIEPFHDRVREAVVARLDADARRTCHAGIATALELAKVSDPEVLATHWAGAGETAKAARYTLIAAEQAAQALAFRRSARLFERALALLPDVDPRRRSVREQLGDALANAGECALAAAAYESAAEGAMPAEGLDLRRRAAEQLLRAGETVRGLKVARDVLAAVDLAIPRTMLGALITLLWLRLVLRLRGLRFVPRALRDIAPSELTRIDICWSVSFTLPVADPLAAGVCHARHVLLALKVGDPVRTARALAMEASYTSSLGFRQWPRANAVLDVARAAAKGSPDPYAHAIVLALGGVAACAAMRFQQAIEELDESVQLFRQNVPGSAFEIANAQFFLFVSLGYTARYGALRPVLERALADAVERGDRYAAVMLRLGVLNSTWLFAGEPERARREIEEARRALPDDRVRAVHHQALIADCYADIFEGEHERGYARFHATLPALRRTLLLHLQTYRTELAAIRARLALGCAARAGDRRREQLVREAEKAVPALGAMPGALGRVNVRLVRANAAILRGKRAEALEIVREMADDADDEAFLSRECARVLLGRLSGDAERAHAGETAIAARGGVATAGLLRITFPAFDDVR